VKADVDDTQHRSAFVSGVKMYSMKSHILTKRVTDNFVRIFALVAISKRMEKKKCFV
jgi:hypothetical protein